MTVQNRVYVALTAPRCAGSATAGRLEPAPFTAYAVTTDLGRENPNADDEELEYLAFTDAASDAATAAANGGPARVVAAADVDADS